MAKATAEKNGKNRIAELEDMDLDIELGTPSVMKPEIIVFDIIGISPLLQNNPADFIGAVEEATLSAGKKVYNDDEEAERRVYRDSHGQIAHPSVAFTRAMFSAVSGKKFGKMTARTAIKGAVFVTEPFSLVLDGDGNLQTRYEIDRRPVVVGKARILRCRPSYPEWRMKIALEVDTAILNRGHVAEALSLAGRIIGIGDYRPEKGGGFGRFRVE